MTLRSGPTTRPPTRAVRSSSCSRPPDRPTRTTRRPASSPNPALTVALPGHDTVWAADKTKIGSADPVTLSWDNGNGLVFHRTISVDEQYMFSVKDSVENKSEAPVTLYPYALVSRHGKPFTSNYAVLHEGLIGEVGDARETQITYDAMEKETGGSRTVDGIRRMGRDHRQVLGRRGGARTDELRSRDASPCRARRSRRIIRLTSSRAPGRSSPARAPT